MMGVGESLVYNPYSTMDASTLPGYDEANSIVKANVKKFLLGCKKHCGSRSLAHKLVRGSFLNGDKFQEADIDEAFSIACGGGCEYEWPYE